MTREQFEVAYRAFCQRRPFRPFLIEFISGHQLSITHPEAVIFKKLFFAMRGADGGNVIFAPDSVARVLDPTSKSDH
jgi:hypothetical protein